MRPHVIMAALASVAACSPPSRGVSLRQIQNMDCAKPFVALAKEIRAKPGIRDLGEQGETAHLFVDDAGWSIYIVTTPAHPGHPAIIHRFISPTTEGPILGTEGCAYGDRRALNADLAAYALLDRALTSEFQCYLCTADHPRSPSLHRSTDQMFPVTRP
jgi:hypothetical protein